MAKTPWEMANNTRPGASHITYFLVRWEGEKMEYRMNKRGNLITYKDRDKAIRTAARLNKANYKSRKANT